MEFMNRAGWLLEAMVMAFVLAVGLVVAALIVIFIIDRMQVSDAIRRNYPVIGRFRNIFIKLGEFFRQYFFAMDREELPFNRAQRDWVKRASAGAGNTIAFGSTRNLAIVGTPIFVNAAYPPLHDHGEPPEPVLIGPTARIPYKARSFFNMSGMSYGAISRPAVEALSRGTAEAGCWLNTGEGGLSPCHLVGGGDVVFQIGTAKYGVRDGNGDLDETRLRAVAAHEQVRMFELKLAQGAKPGKGGILPGAKVTEEIAAIRGIPVGRDSISPNRHKEASNDAELLDLVALIREITGKPTGIKTVFGSARSFRELFALIAQRGHDAAPDFITLDGGEGGTGASPMPLMDLVGVSIREALPLVADMIEEYGLKGRVKLIASGKLINPGDVAWALAAGADFVTSARGFMFALGCIQALKCNRNTCPTGITTHNPKLQKGLVAEEKFLRVASFVRTLREEVGIIAHSVGVSDPRELRRHHVRIVQPDGRSVPMDELFPVARLREVSPSRQSVL